MNKLHLFVRHSPLKNKFLNVTPCVKQTCALKSDDSENGAKNTKKAEAVNKLNDLLKKMVEEEPTQETPKLKLAQAVNQREKFTRKRQVSVKKEPVEKEIVKAVKDVAESVGGNPKVTESELLSKLLSPVSETTEKTLNLTDIVKGMQIDRETKPNDRQSRAEEVKRLLQKFKSQDQRLRHTQQRPRRAPLQKRTAEPVTEKIDLFGSEPLGIFTNKDNKKDGVENETWRDLQQRELRLAVTHPPSNYFQQMILWTEQQKIWKFPIDNEQGLDKEAEVYFAEHVFLDKYLEPWCPQKGPIRHFMELVVVGLSKNPYITVEAKKEHIEWYKNYFEEKKKLLQEVGAIPLEGQQKTEQQTLE